MSTRNSRIFLALSFLLLSTSLSFGWGEVGHQMILRIGIDLMPPGERAPMLSERNYERLDYYVLLPDKMGENDHANYRKTEGPNHYLNTENLGPVSDYESFRSLIKNETMATGRLVHRILESATGLRDAASRGDREELLHWAGFLAHYVGDAHQPLHTTSNHDGKETGNLFGLKDPAGSTVHIRFESGLVNEYAQEIEAQARDLAATYLGTNGGLAVEAARFHADPEAYVTSFVWGAHGHVSEIVDADNRITGQRKNYNMRKGRYYSKMRKAVGELAAQQLARASIAVAAMWYDASSGTRIETTEAQGTGSGELSTAFHKSEIVMPW